MYQNMAGKGVLMPTKSSEYDLMTLADDGDEFADSFSGTLSFSEENDENGAARKSEDAGDYSSDITFSPGGQLTKKGWSCVTFEIINAPIIKEGRSKFVAYSIMIVRPGSDSQHTVVQKRYSDFEKFYTLLKKKFPLDMQDIVFPKKLVTGNFKHETIAQRSRAFEQFLQHAFSIDAVRVSSDFSDFFYGADLNGAFQYIRLKQYKEALPILETVAQIQRKLWGNSDSHVICTLCAIVAAAFAIDQNELAHRFAETTLMYIGDTSQNEFLIPLLQVSIRLCWILGKDKKDLEMLLQKLKEDGHNVDQVPSLLETVLKYHQTSI